MNFTCHNIKLFIIPLYPTGQSRQYPHNQLQWRLTVPSRKYAYLQLIEEQWKLILFQLLIHHQKALTQFKYQVLRLLRNPGRKKLSKSRVEIRSRQSQRGQLQHVDVHRLQLISSNEILFLTRPSSVEPLSSNRL